MITRAHEPVPLPLLITGVAGVAGYNAFHYFRARYPGQVVAIRQEDNWPLTGDGIIPCNAEDHGRLRALFDEYQFQSVLNCAGNCALRACELDSRLAWRTNVEGLINLLSIIVERDVRLVHLSIDLVFSGERSALPPLRSLLAPRLAPYTESDPTDPVTVYGKTMVAAEQLHRRLDARGLHAAHLAADGRQLQRPRRRDRLDPIALQERPARHALLRRNPHARLHRLPQPPLRARAGQRPRRPLPRRRPAGPVALPDRPSRQPRRRLRPEPADGLPAHRSRPDPAARRRRHDEFHALAEALGDDEPLDAWPHDPAFVPTHRDWHHDRNGEPGSRELLARVLYRNPAPRHSSR